MVSSKTDLQSYKSHTRFISLVYIFFGLLVLAVVLLLILISADRVTFPPRVVARKALDAYTLIKAPDLELKNETNWTAKPGDPEPPTIEKIADHYLLVKIEQGGEVRPEMLVSAEEAPLLVDAVAMSIPATPASTLGGQLRVGDLVDVLAFQPAPAGTPAKPQTFEKLLVLKIAATKKEAKVEEISVGEPSVLTLAVPTSKSGDFAGAVKGAIVVTTRKLPARK